MTRRLAIRLSFATLALTGGVAVSGCNKPISNLVRGDVAHSSTDFSSYVVTFSSPAEQEQFEKRLAQWCVEKGYAKPEGADLRALERTDKPGQYQVAGVKYPDPANPGCSILITYRRSGENEAVIGVSLTRDGNNETLDRQAPLLEAQRDTFLQQFDILRRIN